MRFYVCLLVPSGLIIREADWISIMRDCTIRCKIVLDYRT
jgi:hypothetical protein